MKLQRGRIIRWASLALCLAACAVVADSGLCQPYPARPIRLIVASSSSSAADIVARILAQGMSDELGQQVIVDDHPGAGGNIGAQIAAGAPADGYTLFLVTPAHVINSSMTLNPSYDLARNFAPVSQVSSGNYVVVVNLALPVTTIKQLIEIAKSRPGQINFGSGGVGNATHLAVELFMAMTNVKMVHVPYSGAGPEMIALIAGEVQMAIANLTAVIPHVTNEQLRALAVTGSERSPLLPEVPSVSESGVPGYEVTAWFGIAVPKGVPGHIISTLNTSIVKEIRLPQVRQLLTKAGAEPVGSSPEAFAAFIATEKAKWAQVVKQSRIAVR